MEPKLQRWVQRQGWDRAAPSYERFWSRQLRPATDLVACTADLQPGEAVIDVACGTGAVTLPAAMAVGPSGRVLATDLAPKMVAAVLDRCERRGLRNVAAEVRGAEDLGHDAAFDVALCSLGLMYVPEPVTAARELHRVLRPGGRVVVAVWGRRSECGWAEIFPIVDRRVASDVCPMFFALGAPGALTTTLARAGFVDVTEQRISVDLAYADDDEALGAAFAGGPVALAWSRFDDDSRRSAAAEYLDSIARYAAGCGYRIPGEFVVATARTPHRAGEHRPPHTTDHISQSHQTSTTRREMTS